MSFAGHLHDDPNWKWKNTAPPDPIIQGARGERQVNYNSATGRVLFHQSHMPLGEHAGKIMERVPAKYLLDRFHTYGRQKPEVRQRWFPIWSYVQRHLAEIEARAGGEKDSPREYNLIIHTRLVAVEKSHTLDPRAKCELCHDAPQPCECNAQARMARVTARLSK